MAKKFVFKPKRTKMSKKSGLTKTEKSQVKKIAAATVGKIAEDKYMNSQSVTGEPLHAAYLGGLSRIGVLGYSTTLSNTPGGVQLSYGYAPNNAEVPMKELKMLRPFVEQTGNAQTDNYVIDGRECRPRSAICKWRYSRDISEMLQAVGGLPGYSSPGNDPPLTLAQNLPIIFRVIRIIPKQGQSNVLCDPKEDAFLDRYGTAIGINNGLFDDMEMLTYRLNRRRYNVVEDKFFKLQNGLTVQWQRSILSHGGSGANSATRAMLQPIITNCNSNCEKVMTTSHRLTDKKNGSVFYDNSTSATVASPSSGHQREFVLIHGIYAGAETYINNEVVANDFPKDVKISAAPVVKFIDV